MDELAPESKSEEDTGPPLDAVWEVEDEFGALRPEMPTIAERMPTAGSQETEPGSLRPELPTIAERVPTIATPPAPEPLEAPALRRRRSRPERRPSEGDVVPSGLFIASVGMPGSGKSLLSAAAAATGIPVRSLGDLVRAEVAARGLEETPVHVGRIAGGMREEHGDAAWAERMVDLAEAAMDSASWVLIEGMRGLAERTHFMRAWPSRFRVVAVVAPTERRWQRISARGRGEDADRLAFDLRDEREAGWGLLGMIEEADWTLDNETDDTSAFSETVVAWLELVTRLVAGLD